MTSATTLPTSDIGYLIALYDTSTDTVGRIVRHYAMIDAAWKAALLYVDDEGKEICLLAVQQDLTVRVEQVFSFGVW